MHPNGSLIQRFYEAFARGDHATMARCYADDATFGDPVFPDLDADAARAMWRMFCTSGNEIDVSFADVHADDASGSARWEAVYAFPKTGRWVHNKLTASFSFRDGHRLVLLQGRSHRSPSRRLRSIPVVSDGSGAAGDAPRLDTHREGPGAQPSGVSAEALPSGGALGHGLDRSMGAAVA